MAYSRPGVYISERLLPAPIGAGAAANAAGAIAAPFAQGPETVTLVNSWYEFTKYFGGYNAAYPSSFGVAQFFANGGRELYVKRILASNASSAAVTVSTAGSVAVFTATAKNRGSDGTNLRIEISAGTVSGTYTLTLTKETVAGTSSNTANDYLLERYENIVFDPTFSTSSDYANTVINTTSGYITISNNAAGVPASGVYPLTVSGSPVNGGDGATVAATDYTSYAATSTSVWNEFNSVNRPLVIFTPNIYAVVPTSTATVTAAASAWAEANNGFYVAETAAGLTVDAAIAVAQALSGRSSTAMYYPHAYISDPVGRGNGALRLVGPSGAIVGKYLSTDASIGVFKAPAGLRSPVAGMVALERVFTTAELDRLNVGLPTANTGSVAPVNPLRQIPGAGIVVMGARTLLQDGTANRYINMRRSLIYIKARLKALTEFAIFENNDERLWSQINGVIDSFLNEYRNQGGLRGGPTQAYFIKCDAENNPANLIAQGEVHIEVGVALQYPAEFIVIDLSQKTLN
jgi:phage tail sheath protein FI